MDLIHLVLARKAAGQGSCSRCGTIVLVGVHQVGVGEGATLVASHVASVACAVGAGGVQVRQLAVEGAPHNSDQLL